MARKHTCEGCGAELYSSWATLCEDCNVIIAAAQAEVSYEIEDYDA